MIAFCAAAQDLYIGSFYVTSTNDESSFGDGKDKWTTRRTHIYNMFKFELPDVLGLQGLTSAQLSQMRINMGYNGAGDILYSKSLELDTCGTVTDMPEGNTCSWARLKKDGTAFYVFNFCFTPDSALVSTMRLRTAAGEINTENLPSFAVGYLGAKQTTTAYSRLTAKFIDCYTKATIKSAEFGTINNFDLENNHGTDRYDFVMASAGISVKAYGQLQYGYFTLEADNSHKRRQLSTHFPVMAKVTLP